MIASVVEGRFADEIAVVGTLRQPLAILHGEDEQPVSLDYLRTLTIPGLWRGAVQVIPGVGHALHLEAPDTFAALLEQFRADPLGTARLRCRRDTRRLAGRCG